MIFLLFKQMMAFSLLKKLLTLFGSKFGSSKRLLPFMELLFFATEGLKQPELRQLISKGGLRKLTPTNIFVLYNLVTVALKLIKRLKNPGSIDLKR